MSQLTPFTYRKGSTLLHHLDARCKFFMLCLISISLLSATLIPSAILFLFLIIGFITTQTSLFYTLGQIKYFIILLCFIFMTRAITMEGIPYFTAFGINITKEGMLDGFLVAFKFLLIMLSGVLFSMTTQPSTIKSAVQWYLKPIPFIPEKRVAVMISLSLSFMPIILRQANEISDAQKARCGDLEKNPIKRISRLIIPLLKRVFLNADSLILAMESRCYTEDRTDPVFSPSGYEPYFLVGSCSIALGLFFFHL